MNGVSSLDDRRAKKLGDQPPRAASFGTWFAEHPVWTMLGAMVLLFALVTTLILASISAVGDRVTDANGRIDKVGSEIGEVRKELGEVRKEVGGLTGEIGYVKGRLDAPRAGSGGERDDSTD